MHLTIFSKYALLAVIWISSIYACTQSSNVQNSQHTSRIEHNVSTKEIEVPQISDSVIDSISGLELPAILKSDEIIRHAAYTLKYDEKHEQASWVAYHLTSDETYSKFTRTDKFIIDPIVRNGSAENKDYKGSGYDRGHLAPAADMGWSAQSMKESFYFSNMSPQVPGFNRGIWKQLEELIRTWAMQLEELYIVTGPVLSENLPSIGPNEVSIPNYYYKVILAKKDNAWQGIGFILKNESSNSPLSNYSVPIDSVERFTGIDFFNQLPEHIESDLEKRVCAECWTWNKKKSTLKSAVSENKNTAIKTVQCSGITKSGKRCKRKTTNANGRCFQHD
jgi:endonuclease G